MPHTAARRPMARPMPAAWVAALAFGVVLVLAPIAGAETPAPRTGLFAVLFAPQDPAAGAERVALRKERQAQRAAERAIARGEAPDPREVVKAAVAHAIENRPRGRLWCVPFARAVAGVDLRGNAKTWWAQAKGRYDRGAEPQVGAVMSFAASRAMPMGHVAVVSGVIDDRRILVDHANWDRNRITQDQLVVDVSEKGDWSQVRVANAEGSLGRVNPVNGFIYN